MTTVTGNLQDAEGKPLPLVKIEVVSQSTPQFLPGVIVGHTACKLQSDPNGFFSFSLVPGNYKVTYFSRPYRSVFNIVVPDSGSPLNISNLIV